jgi:hypothetical protein
LANNPNIKNSELQNLQNLFAEADKNLRNTSSVKEAFKNIQKFIKKVELRSEIPFENKNLHGRRPQVPHEASARSF